jgi:hypothetical protein
VDDAALSYYAQHRDAIEARLAANRLGECTI